MDIQFLHSLVMVFTVSLIPLDQLANIQNGLAQTNEDISITVGSSSFAPLTTVHGNQVRVSVTYQVNDESLENEKINGIMKLYSSNGTLIHSSSFPEGFIAKKKGGTEDFKTTIRDPAINSLIANVTFVDLDKKNTLSNTVTTNLNLEGSEKSTTTSSIQEQEVNDDNDNNQDEVE